ncbi:HNH endonuclease [Novilysobacter spongiicola]|uniref:HNH endonuclease n=1 Tax=Novilysobacter spongiicola TaxID=435289 RepID=UPI001F2D7C4B|nr:HNH endonuclease signature motif containing protein [Lysobacter spongiicola]
MAELVARELDVPPEDIMLLRHSSESVKKLLATGGTVEDYTYTQPTGSAYDYHHPDKTPIKVVVVIVRDRVYGVFKVLGVEREGTTYSLTSAAHRRFDIERGKPPRPAKRFSMLPVHTAYADLTVQGWEGRSRTAVQRSDGSFFLEIVVAPPIDPEGSEALQEQLDRRLQAALTDTPAQRRQRLMLAPKLPRKISVATVAFVRNADVIAEVLLRAAGKCESCFASAPFFRRTDHSPYLEVHHRIRLADGGEDTVANAIALCPNCHRREHYA